MVATQFWSGHQRRWFSLIATSGMSVNSRSRSGVNESSSRPWSVVTTGVVQYRARRKPNVSRCEWITSNSSACFQTASAAISMKPAISPLPEGLVADRDEAAGHVRVAGREGGDVVAAGVQTDSKGFDDSLGAAV